MAIVVMGQPVIVKGIKYLEENGATSPEKAISINPQQFTELGFDTLDLPLNDARYYIIATNDGKYWIDQSKRSKSQLIGITIITVVLVVMLTIFIVMGVILNRG